MQLSPKLILWHFSQEFSLKASPQITSEPCLRRAVCHESQESPSGGLIYVASELCAGFQSHPLHSLMLVTAPPDPELSKTISQPLLSSGPGSGSAPGTYRPHLSGNMRSGTRPCLNPE